MEQITLKIGNNEYELIYIKEDKFCFEGDKLPDFEFCVQDKYRENLWTYKSIVIDNKFYGAKLINK